MTRPRTSAPGRASRGGFSLLEMAVVLILISLLFASGLRAVTAYIERGLEERTEARLDEIERALSLYVARNKRLPCPADASLADGDAMAGLARPVGASATCTAGIAIAGVPWRNLGLSPEIAVDGWGRRIRYEVFDGASDPDGPGGVGPSAATSLTRMGGMDMSVCQAAATDSAPAADCAATRNPIAFLSNKGLRILEAAGGAVLKSGVEVSGAGGPAAGGGAAFVLISHGRDGAGAYLRNGTRLAVPPAAQLDQAENADDDSDFVERRINDGTTTVSLYYDDRVRAPTIDTVAAAAVIGPDTAGN